MLYEVDEECVHETTREIEGIQRGSTMHIKLLLCDVTSILLHGVI